MFCQQCGKEIPDGAKFCAYCGAPISVEDKAVPAAEETGFIPVQDDVPPVSDNTGYIPPVSDNTGYVPPVNDNAGYIPPVQPRAPYAQPAYGGGYTPVSPAAKPAKRSTSKWPSVIGVMGIISLVFYLASMVMMFLYYQYDLYMPIGSFISSNIISILIAIAIPVLFFVHTKKVAFVTAIPMLISLVLSGVYTFRDIQYMDSMAVGQNVLIFGFELLLVIFYILQMTIRPHNPAFSILYLIFAILMLILDAVFVVMFIVESYAPDYLILWRILNFVSGIFLSVGYIVAMFSSRKK